MYDIQVVPTQVESGEGVRRMRPDPNRVIEVLQNNPNADVMLVDGEGREIRKVSAAFLRGYLLLDCKFRPELLDAARSE